MTSATRSPARSMACSGRPPLDGDGADGLGAGLGGAVRGDLDVGAHVAQHVDDAGARWVQADVLDDDVGVRVERRPRPARPRPRRCRRARSCRAPRSRPDRPTVVTGPSRRTGVPSQASMRSVWSRVGPGAVMVVVPLAARAASVRQPMTWALATRSSWSTALSGRRPVTTSGAWPSVVATSAPTRAQRRRHALHGPARERGVADQRGRGGPAARARR